MTRAEDQAAPSDGPDPWTAYASLFAGLALAIALLFVAKDRWFIRVQDAALGGETAGYAGAGDIQCQGAASHERCLSTYRAAGSGRSILWLGNSQLDAVNRIQPGDRNAPVILHDRLAARGRYLVVYQMPNANLSEHILATEAVLPAYRPDVVILPVCYDDIRELAVRDDVAALLEQPGLRRRLAATRYGRQVLAAAGVQTDRGEAAVNHDDPRSIRPKVEAALVGALEQHSDLWKQRDSLRGMLGFAIHTLRNKALGINSQTKRAVDPTLYRERMTMLGDYLNDLRARGVRVLLYVPPYRQNVSGPYIEGDYAAFKHDLAAMATRNGADYADLDAIVPGPEWGMVTDSLFGFQEYDFMHFTGDGHRRLADALDARLQAMSF
ncbi:MAG: hypothetical protein AABZ45_10085 [Pseudomonadota bacterium]